MQLLGVSFGNGNEKMGNIFSFSLPGKITCPGASEWCLKKCYGYRYEIRRPKCRKAYLLNLLLTKKSEEFTRLMIGIIPRIIPSFRIHVSGDFYSVEYIQCWTKICEQFPTTKFWSYTRSWNVEALLPHLDKLRSLDNVQLFASIDHTMLSQPEGWRIAFIKGDERASGIICPAQINDNISCDNCGYCFNKNDGNVIFKIH